MTNLGCCVENCVQMRTICAAEVILRLMDIRHMMLERHAAHRFRIAAAMEQPIQRADRMPK